MGAYAPYIFFKSQFRLALLATSGFLLDCFCSFAARLHQPSKHQSRVTDSAAQPGWLWPGSVDSRGRTSELQIGF